MSVVPAYIASPARSEVRRSVLAAFGVGVGWGGGHAPAVLHFMLSRLSLKWLNSFHLLTRFLDGGSMFDKFGTNWPLATITLECGGQLMCLLVCLLYVPLRNVVRRFGNNNNDPKLCNIFGVLRTLINQLDYFGRIHCMKERT